MICFYRYSDKGKDPKVFGHKKSKKDCWQNFYKHFSENHIVVFCDNCEKDSVDFFKFQCSEVIETNLGNSQGAIYAYNYALEHYPNEDYYFCEDDYIHRGENLSSLIKECLEYSDYCSLYDHGDKYRNFSKNPNPLLRSLGEATEVFRTESSHWKLTNSTTMTFATKYEVLKKDMEIYPKFATMSIPKDFELFLELYKNGRSLATPIPSRSTHLSPNVDDIAPFFKI